MIKESTRKELIEYYKWVVAVTGFFLTFSVSLVKIGTKARNVYMTIGWCFLFISVFFNWLIIKRLIILPLVKNFPEDEKTWKHRIYEKTFGNLSLYGSIQSNAILIGAILLLVGFLKF